MHLIYIDESKESVGSNYYIYTALCIKVESWYDVFSKIKAMRKHLKDEYGIHPNKELHASKFVAGKGLISDRVLNKQLRAEIYKRILSYVSKIKNDNKEFCLFNSANTIEERAFERLINRIDRTMIEWDSHAILFFDEGQEVAFTKRIRRMRVVNFIPSKFGAKSRNIPLSRIIEDPVFKDSAQSYFIQIVDFCAYVLLRMDRPLENKTTLGYDRMFNILEPICYKKTNPKDSMGVIR